MIRWVNLDWPQKNGANRKSKNWRMLLILMCTSAHTLYNTPCTHRHAHIHRRKNSHVDTQTHIHTDTQHTHSLSRTCTLSHTRMHTSAHRLKYTTPFPHLKMIGCVNLYWPQKNGENRNSKNWRMLVILMYTSALTRKSTPYTHRHRHKHRCIHSYTDTQPHRHTDTHTLSHTHSYTHPHTNCGTAFKIDLKYCMCKVMDGDKN